MRSSVDAEKGEMGIYLTPVTPTCSVPGCGGLSARSAGVGGALFDRSGLPEVSVSASLAGRAPVPALRWDEELAEVGRSHAVCQLRLNDDVSS